MIDDNAFKLVRPITGMHEHAFKNASGQWVRNFGIQSFRGHSHGHWENYDFSEQDHYISTLQRVDGKPFVPGKVSSKNPTLQSFVVKGLGGPDYYKNLAAEGAFRKVFVIDIDLTDEEKKNIQTNTAWKRAALDTKKVAEACIRRWNLDGCTVMMSGGGFYVVVWPEQHGETEVSREFWFEVAEEVLDDAGVSLKHRSDLAPLAFRGVFRLPGSLNHKYKANRLHGHPQVKVLLSGGFNQILRGTIHPWNGMSASRLTVRTIRSVKKE